MKKILLGVFALSLGLIISSCNKEEVKTNQEDITQPDKASYSNISEEVIPGQYIVVLKTSLNKNDVQLSYENKIQAMKSEAKQLGIEEGALKHAYGAVLNGFAAKLNEEQLKHLKSDSRVAYIAPDKMFSLGDMNILRGGPPTPTEPPAQSVPFGITRVGSQDATGKTAWIVDTGVDLDHPDINVDGSKGYDFINNDAYADDDNGHGSHCAGTVAGIDNEIGVVGVAANATIVPVKVLDRRGSGAYSVIIAGIDFVAANASPGDAVNMSLGGGVYQPIDDAVFAASENGIFFALAAGNESDDANNHSPARVNGQYIWTVSAMDINDDFAYFSNYGNPPIDYCMPGVDIFSTYKSGGFATMSGTSMAAPHMCGVLLLTGGNPATDGYVNGDPDGTPDPIGHL
ncbi:MAG: S8 family peptidase [Bacteroidota bacterium]